MTTLLALAALSTGQPAPLPADGSELFRGLLHRSRFVPARADGPDPPLVVVFGDPGGGPDVPARCRRVLDAGGAVLVVAARFDRLANALPGRPLVTLRRVVPVRRDVPLLDESSATLVEPTDNAPPDAPAVPLGLMVAERGAILSVPGLPPFAAANGLPFGLTVGRATVLAGESVFGNALLAGRFPDGTDTGNLVFALAVLGRLRPPGDGPFPCLFVERGRVVERFDAVDFAKALEVAPPTPAPPPLSALLERQAQAKLADAANESIDLAQRTDRLGRGLAEQYPKVTRWLLGVLAAFALVALLRRGRAARRPPDPPLVKADRPAEGFARRREELLRGGDHTRAVRDYLAELFAAHGLPLDRFNHPTRLPAVEADPAIRRQLATLWEAAYGPAPVTFGRWKELEPMVEAVQQAGAAGRWRFAGGRA